MPTLLLRLAAPMQAWGVDSKFDIRPEHYSASFELTIYWEIKYKDIQDLHERVLAIANVVDIGAGIGKEMLGSSFER